MAVAEKMIQKIQSNKNVFRERSAGRERSSGRQEGCAGVLLTCGNVAGVVLTVAIRSLALPASNSADSGRLE